MPKIKTSGEFNERFHAKQRGIALEKKAKKMANTPQFKLKVKNEPGFGSDGSKETSWTTIKLKGVTFAEAEPEPPKKPSRPQITWDDIAGCDVAKEALREAIEYPTQFGELYAAYGHSPSKGVLLYGPPGNGKTLLARAAATALGIVISDDDDSPPAQRMGIMFGPQQKPPAKGFIALNGAEVANCYFGETEKKIREIFAEAREYKRQNGKPAVIFIDEADAILSDRNSGNFASRIAVPSFLAELDGMRDSGAFVLLATNRADSLDPAICRDGRIDRKIFIGRPDRKGCQKLLELALRGKPQAEGGLVNMALECVWADSLALFDITFEDGSCEKVLFRDAVSGAMMVGIIRRAVEFALVRDRANIARGVSPSGISCADIRSAVWQAHIELQQTSQFDLMYEKIAEVGKVPVGARKAIYAKDGVPWHLPRFAGEEKVVVRTGGAVLN